MANPICAHKRKSTNAHTLKKAFSIIVQAETLPAVWWTKIIYWLLACRTGISLLVSELVYFWQENGQLQFLYAFLWTLKHDREVYTKAHALYYEVYAMNIVRGNSLESALYRL